MIGDVRGSSAEGGPLKLIPSPQELKPDLGLKTVESKATEIPYPEGLKPNYWKPPKFNTYVLAR